MLRKERIFTEDKPEFTERKRTGELSFRVPHPSKTREMLQDLLEGLNALRPRLDAIERDIKEIKEVVGIGKVSSIRNKRVKKNR